MYLTSAG